MHNRVTRDNNGVSYPTWVGFIFIFNLIVGTGALALPAVFAKAGWLLSLLILIMLAFISYITVTFVIEVMACANAVKNWHDLQFANESDANSETDMLLPRSVPSGEQNMPALTSSSSSESNVALLERIPINLQHSTDGYYKLERKFELGEVAVLFFNDAGRILFYLCITTYLYGDLSIYSAAVSKTLRDIICYASNSSNTSGVTQYNFADNDATMACWTNHTITRLSVYRLLLISFCLVFGPLAAFNVQKTKYLQILTALFRWLAFILMISLAIKLLITDGAKGHPPAANFYATPALFGACVYSFMCHHSLPSLLTPIRNKSQIRKILCYDYILICCFYILLAMTGIFAFENLQDLYTLNFIPSNASPHSFQADLLMVVDYFLTLFPVFTLSASFPIIAITLRNNLQALFLDMTRIESYSYFLRRILFPVCTVVPPFIITYFTESLTSLIAFTGSYAGVGIQYIIPISLVYYARSTCTELLGNGIINEFRSPFRSAYWLLFVLIWAFVCMGLVTINFFIDSKLTG